MLQFSFDPFPNLSTPRLLLRKIETDDADDFFIMRSDAQLMKFIPRPLAQDRNDVLKLIEQIHDGVNKNETIMWAIVLKDNNQFVGTIGFVRSKPAHQRAEVGYMIHQKFYGMGFTTEALKVVIDYGFNEMKLHSMEAVIDPENLASERVLQKCNFLKEAHFRESDYWKGEFRDSVVYSLLQK